MSATEIDEAKLEAFMGQAVTDMGAIISAPLMLIGEKLGLYKAMAGAGPLTSQEVAERAGRRPSATCASGCATRPPAATSTYDPETDRYTLPDEHALALADEDSPVYILGRVRPDRLALRRRGPDPRGVPQRRGDGLARARPPPVPRHRAVLPARLPRQPGRRVDPGARRRAGEARTRREGRRRRLRPRRLDDHHGAGLPELRVLRLRLPRRLDRACARGGRGGGRRRPHRRSRSHRPRTTRAATTTSSACSTACTTWATRSAPPRTSARRSPTDGTWMIVEPFAERPRRGQPQPGRARLLRRLDRDLHAGVALPGGRPRARRAGRRGAPDGGRQRGRLHARPPRDRDAVQPGPRGTAVGAASWADCFA